MSYKSFLTSIFFGSLLSWFGCFLVVNNTDPSTTEGALWLFYFTFGLSLFGTLTGLGLVLRQVIIKNEDALLRHLKQSLRQAILVTLATLITLKLLSSNLFTWWIGIIIFLLIILIEAFFYSKRTLTSGYVQ